MLIDHTMTVDFHIAVTVQCINSMQYITVLTVYKNTSVFLVWAIFLLNSYIKSTTNYYTIFCCGLIPTEVIVLSVCADAAQPK